MLFRDVMKNTKKRTLKSFKAMALGMGTGKRFLEDKSFL